MKFRACTSTPRVNLEQNCNEVWNQVKYTDKSNWQSTRQRTYWEVLVLKSNYLDSFGKGGLAGIVSLGFLFILRLGAVARFPPDAAFQEFLKVIPASVQEPSVQILGGFAG